MQAAVWAAALAIAAQASAALYDITLSGGPIDGTGQITATPNGDGSYTAISGSFDLTSGAFNGAQGAVVPTSEMNLIGVGVWSYRAYGGTDFVGLDNKVFPGQAPVVDSNGLMFNDVSFVGPGGAGLAYALWYDGSNYHLTVNGARNQPYWNDYVGGTLTLTAVAVPERTTMIAGAGALLLVLLGAGLHSKQSGVVRIGK
ncbi:MAG: hypothetical protein ABSH34_23965 [Verrucomicrobiota bacterium]